MDDDGGIRRLREVLEAADARQDWVGFKGAAIELLHTG